MSLADKTCKPCHGGVPKLTAEEWQPLLKELHGWKVEDGKLLRKQVKTSDFMESLELANSIGETAEQQQHHPDLLVKWGELRIDISTHAVGGLTEADFILAAKIDRLL